MADRLSSVDVSFLYLEEPTTPMHVGSVMVFEGLDGGADLDRLTEHVSARVAYVPRYRQRVRTVPGRLANPVWIDDEHFDIGFHVRRSALPRPGDAEQLQELVARLMSRPLDRSRPLWELVLVEGLSGGRFAVVTKVHQALVDGVQAVDLGQVVLDATRAAVPPPPQVWHPPVEPTAVELLVSAMSDSVRRPRHVVETARAAAADVRSTAGRVAETVGGLVRTAARPTPRSPLNQEISAHRRFAIVETDLADHKAVRAGRRTAAAPPPDLGDATVAAAPGPTVNDVVLAVLTGALRTWLLTRGEPVRPTTVVRAMVPVSVRAADEAPGTAFGGRVSSLLVDLPAGEGSPLVRLHQIAYQTRAHREAGQAVDAPTLAGIAGFAPPTLHSLGVRVAGGLSRHVFNLMVSNVPGPQVPLYLDGARMLATYPVVPLVRGQALAIGVTSYDGRVFYGLNADRDAMPDLPVLAQCVADSLAETVEAAR